MSSSKRVFMSSNMPTGPGPGNGMLAAARIGGFHGDKELPW